MIYLDNAATSGIKPPAVIGAVDTALRKYNANPGRSGYKTAMDTAYKIYGVRSKIKDFRNRKPVNPPHVTPGL